MSNNLLDRVSNLEMPFKVAIFVGLSIVLCWLFTVCFGWISGVVPFSGFLAWAMPLGIIAYLAIKIFKRDY